MKRWISLSKRTRRHVISRKKISGTKEKPRLNVYRSLNHIYAQILDDANGQTILSLSTTSSVLRDKVKKDSGNVKGASMLGEALAALCKSKGITKVVFDRGGYLYHGRVKALAEAARKGGLEF